MRRLTFGMNLSVDGYIAAPGVIVTHPVLVGGDTPFFTALGNWVRLTLVETRTFPDGVVLTRYEAGR